MRRSLFLLLLITIPVLFLFPQTPEMETRSRNPDSQKPRIAVFRPRNLAGASHFDGVCIAIGETISLNLKLIGSHEIVEYTEPAPEEEAILLQQMQEASIDNAVYGDLLINDSGTIAVNISVYGRREEGVTSSQEVSAESYFDIFDTSEELVTRLLGTFSDRHIAYGRLRLENQSDFGRYIVLMNQQEVGRNIREIPRLLTGSYTLTILQPRGMGEAILFEEDILIKKGEELGITFSMPQLLEEERQFLVGVDAELMRWWGIDEEKTEDLLRDAITLCRIETEDETVAVSPALASLEVKYKELQEQAGKQRWGSPSLNPPTGLETRRLFSFFNAVEPPLAVQYPVFSIIQGEPEKEEPSEQKKLLRFDSQIAGGTLGMVGNNITVLDDHLQFSLFVGAGFGSSYLGALAVRLTWALFNKPFTPTLSLYGLGLTNIASGGFSVGPSIGFELRLFGGKVVVYLENNLTTNIIPNGEGVFFYLPSLGVKF